MLTGSQFQVLYFEFEFYPSGDHYLQLNVLSFLSCCIMALYKTILPNDNTVRIVLCARP